MVMANKPRVGVFLRQGAGMKSGNMSAELVDLQKRYKEMNANFRKMDKALKQRHQAMIKMDEARNAVSIVQHTVAVVPR